MTRPVLAAAIFALTASAQFNNPRLVHKCSPRYTEEARAAKIEGNVLLAVELDEEGHFQSIKVTRSLGHGLDETAVEGVKQWRFEPATRNGHPVSSKAAIEVNFRL